MNCPQIDTDNKAISVRLVHSSWTDEIRVAVGKKKKTNPHKETHQNFVNRRDLKGTMSCEWW